MLMRNLTLSDANEKPYAIKKYDTEKDNMKLADLYHNDPKFSDRLCLGKQCRP